MDEWMVGEWMDVQVGFWVGGCAGWFWVGRWMNVQVGFWMGRWMCWLAGF